MRNNHREEDVKFLVAKVKELKTAIFKPDIYAELQLPANIVQTLKVESNGTIWFFTSCLGTHAQQLERSFYGYLDYHKKGSDCCLKLSGEVTVIDKDPESLLSMSNYSEGIFERLVLVKMKIARAEYFESYQSENVSLKEKIKTVFNYLFTDPVSRTYDFS